MNLKNKLSYNWQGNITEEQREILLVQMVLIYVLGIGIGAACMALLYTIYG